MMNFEAQAAALAKAAGYKEVEKLNWAGARLDPPKQFMRCCGHLAHYDTLDGLHTLCLELGHEKLVGFAEVLRWVVERDTGHDRETWIFHFCVYNATVVQRREAILRALELWVETANP